MEADRAHLKNGSRNRPSSIPGTIKRKKKTNFVGFYNMYGTVYPGHKHPSSTHLEGFSVFLDLQRMGLYGPPGWTSPSRAHLNLFLDSLRFPSHVFPLPHLSSGHLWCTCTRVRAHAHTRRHTHTHTRSTSDAFTSCFLPCFETEFLTECGVRCFQLD